ncbi:Sugar fermentation stimulation protein [Yersinia kristensenii ATCC 33638]|nr:Sugar fermentation stimulation protein [Yersinia kristensenii ATCC 33638]
MLDLVWYRDGHITIGATPKNSAIIRSPLGQGRVRAFARVDELNPANLDNSAREEPFLCIAAMISALCQSFEY